MDDTATLERWIGLLNQRRFADVEAEAREQPDLLARSSTANLIRATALESLERVADAAVIFDRSVELEPKNVAAQNNRAGFLERQGRFADALQGYEAALAVAPSLAVLHVNRGRMLGKLENSLEALAALDRAATLQPTLVEAHHERGLALERLDRSAEAEQAYRAALQLAPEREPPRIDLVKLLYRAKRFAECLDEIERGLAALPRSATLYYWRGATLRVEGKLDAALEALDQCLSLRPGDVGALCDKGQILESQSRTAAALAAFEQALAVDPDHVTALSGVAATSWTLGDRERASAIIDRALRIDPRRANSLLIRAYFYQRSGDSHDALEDARTAVEVAPKDPRGWHLLADLASERGDLVAALGFLEKALALAPAEPAIESAILWNLLHVPDADRDDVVAKHRSWGQRLTQAVGGALDRRSFPCARDPERRLRVGFVSADLENHPVGRLLNAVLPSFDPARLEITCYTNSPDNDDVTAQIRARSDRWREIWSLDDTSLAGRVREDAIDILVDLSGHTKGNRLRCFARRAAPVQATLWGYPFSTGIPAVDHIILDEAAIPIGADDLCVERVVRLPGGRFRLRPPQYVIPVSMPPSTRRGLVTFGSFNNVAKLNDRVFDAWSEILRQVPRSRLLLKWFNLVDPEIASTIRQSFTSRGIQAERLEFRGASDYDKMLAEYADMDIALDPFPFSGGVTSFETLWMGVPIVTLPSWQPVSRQTLGYLQAIGRQSLAAKDTADYVAVAVRLASDPSLLMAWRFSQRFAVEKSTIGDFAGAARELQDAFRTMWKDFLSETEGAN